MKQHLDTLFVMACLTWMTSYQMYLGVVLQGGISGTVIGGMLGYMTKAGVDAIKKDG